MNDKIKNSLLLILFGILSLPLLEKFQPVRNQEMLYGVYTSAPDSAFSWDRWWAGRYQPGAAAYLNDHMLFRPFLIRLNNQLNYSLFSKANTAIIGKEHCLFDHVYIDTWLGKDYIGYQPLKDRLLKLRALQDTLARMGKTLVFVHAASKPYFFPEYLPDYLARQPRGTTNFDVCIRIADSLGINQVDFNSWLVSMKNKTEGPLYTKQGLHWSMYGAALCDDSLIKYIERIRGIQMPGPKWTTITHDTRARATDDDLGKPLNLLFPFLKETFSYPDIYFDEDSTKKKLNAVYIGDSFTFQWISMGTLSHEYASWQFWYYFNEVCSENYVHGSGANTSVKEIDWMAEIKKADVVVLVYTPANLFNIGSGFVDTAYNYFYPGK